MQQLLHALKGLTAENDVFKASTSTGLVSFAMNVKQMKKRKYIMLFVAIAIKAYDGGPVLYKQERSTLNGRKFMIYKFRSMLVRA